MRLLKLGCRGEDVERWQTYLIGEDYPLVADGHFGPVTQRATKRWQNANTLVSDGIVGNESFAVAIADGFMLVDTTNETTEDKYSLFWPPKPDDLSPMNHSKRVLLFGKFKYDHTPTKRNPEKILVTDDWRTDNIIRVVLPEAAQKAIGKKHVLMHRKVSKQFVALLMAWEKADLLGRIVSWNGSYVARYVRGSRKTLSNHAFGSAFDLNVVNNRLGRVPALVGEQGCVRELVPLANKHGFWWGGHYGKRADGMHFEAAKVL
jgi:hypothetical protein